jgi:hypothetical protein
VEKNFETSKQKAAKIRIFVLEDFNVSSLEFKSVKKGSVKCKISENGKFLGILNIDLVRFRRNFQELCLLVFSK